MNHGGQVLHGAHPGAQDLHHRLVGPEGGPPKAANPKTTNSHNDLLDVRTETPSPLDYDLQGPV